MSVAQYLILTSPFGAISCRSWRNEAQHSVCVLPSKDSSKCVFNHLTHKKIRSHLNVSECLFSSLSSGDFCRAFNILSLAVRLRGVHLVLWGRLGGEGVGGGFVRTGGGKTGKQPGKRMWTARGAEHSGFARFNVDSVKGS